MYIYITSLELLYAWNYLVELTNQLNQLAIYVMRSMRIATKPMLYTPLPAPGKHFRCM